MEIVRIDDPKTNAGVRAAMITKQNDAFRKASCGQPVGDDVPLGRMVVTRGIDEQGPMFVLEALRKVAAFDEFTLDSDPYGFHEMGVMEVQTLPVWWKIDLYDENYEFGSSAPEDTRRTRRVLTILFPSEY